MQKAILCSALLLALSVSGCLDALGLDSESEGTLEIGLVDDLAGVTFSLEGVFARAAGTEDGWVQLVGADDAAQWSLDGDGTASSSATVVAQAYDLVQMVFAGVSQGSDAAVMTENGFVLPVGFNVTDGGTTTVSVGLAWGDALFESQQGLAFAPALRKVSVTEDGVQTVDLEAAEIDAGPTAAPVARMRVLDETWQIWESDFLAESASMRKKGTAGNLTFLASGSEPLAPGATLASFQWEFSDGVTLDGQTVNRVFDLGGGNISVTLTVTDSLGVSDNQRLDLALAPGSETLSQPWRLDDLTGLSPSNGEACSGASATPGTVVLPFDPSVTPQGAAAGVSRIELTMNPQAPHPGADVDVVLTDGSGAAIFSESGNDAAAELGKNFDPAGAQPVAGDWTITAYPCKAYSITVTGFLTAIWEGVADPAFVAWYEGYDDGENR